MWKNRDIKTEDIANTHKAKEKKNKQTNQQGNQMI
jgi:hypothetical protein